MAQVATPVGTGVEVMRSQFEVIAPVVAVESVPGVAGHAVRVSGLAVALIGVEAMAGLSIAVQAGTVNVSAVEGNPLTHVGPELKTDSVDEARRPAVTSVFAETLSVIHVGPGGLVSEVAIRVVATKSAL